MLKNVSFVLYIQIFKYSEENMRHDTVRKAEQFRQKLEHENKKLGTLFFYLNSLKRSQ